MTQLVHKYDVIILGAGAAGLMCAWIAGSRGKRVLILDHSHKLAEKIRISGGGRCNFTNINADPQCYISQNPNFMISALARYTPYHFTELLDQHQVKYHEKTLGQLFCDNSAEDIIRLLDSLCTEHGVKRLMGCKITDTSKSSNGYTITTNLGSWHSEALVIATGGLSIPKIGATNFGYELAKKFGLNIIPPRPGLVPMTMSTHDLTIFSALSGISFLSQVHTQYNHKKSRLSFLENTLITHRGLSGPAILQISSYWDPGQDIILDLLPNITTIASEINLAKKSNPNLSNFLSRYLSARLAQGICNILKLNTPLAELSNDDINYVEHSLHNFVLKPNGTEGYKKAEVTVGGIDTDELSSKTMMANNVEGLYFIGEVVDVTGWLGGYNFQWAWASAHAAATYI